MDLSFTLQQYLVVALPIVLPWFSSTVAALLRQDGFPAPLNDAIAFLCLLASAIVSAYAAGQLSGDPTGIVSAIISAMTLLIQGALHNFAPYVSYLNLLQALSVVKPKQPPPPTQPTPQQPVSTPQLVSYRVSTSDPALAPTIHDMATQSVPTVHQVAFPPYDQSIFNPITSGYPTVQ